ncbi:uncharacterized protein LOC130957713 [Arachis stenosperma]|uniref:uncharacterized protein LOC130957713 n=1 Tax=Arachis stenosperma TaxID=217475 RepID=UPI0025AD27D4|nr:uncharacterized protein LOC130957713 [Arachis stenosperma]
MAWAIELSQYDIQYEPHHAIKVQAMVDFLVKVVDEPPEASNTRCKLHVNGASNQAFSGIEYKAMIGGLMLAREIGVARLEVNSDSEMFFDKKFREFLSSLGIKQKFSSVEHLQSNGQLETANKVILKGLKKRLKQRKGSWTDKLALFLWSYRTTPQSAIGETPFRLIYGVDAVIPIKIGGSIPRLLLGGDDEASEKDLIDETRTMTHLSEVVLNQRLALRYNHKHNDIGPPIPKEGELSPNWKGPYRMKEVQNKDAYKLKKLDVERRYLGLGTRRTSGDSTPNTQADS